MTTSKGKTAGDLLNALRVLPPEALDLPVVMEGCDCEGEFGDVGVNTECIFLARIWLI